MIAWEKAMFLQQIEVVRLMLQSHCLNDQTIWNQKGEKII